MLRDSLEWQLPGSFVLSVLCESTSRSAAKLLGVSRNWRDVGRHTSLVHKITLEKPIEIAKKLDWSGLKELNDSKAGLLFRDSEFKRTLLHWAATNNHVTLARASIAAGVGLETKDFFGCTPLMLAAYYGSLDTLKLLCEAGGDVDASDDYGRTSLCFAAWMGCDNSTKELIAQGSDINRTDEDGWSPLMYAAYGSHHSVASILLSEGANIEQQSCTDWLDMCPGSSSAQIAEQMGDFDLAEKISLYEGRRHPLRKVTKNCHDRYYSESKLSCPKFISYFFDAINQCLPSFGHW